MQQHYPIGIIKTPWPLNNTIYYPKNSIEFSRKHLIDARVNSRLESRMNFSPVSLFYSKALLKVNIDNSGAGSNARATDGLKDDNAAEQQAAYIWMFSVAASNGGHVLLGSVYILDQQQRPPLVKSSLLHRRRLGCLNITVYFFFYRFLTTVHRNNPAGRVAPTLNPTTTFWLST